MSIACAAGRNPPLVPYTLFSRSGRSFTPFLLSLFLSELRTDVIILSCYAVAHAVL